MALSAQLTALLKTAVRMTAAAEADFNAVDRIIQYIELDEVEDKEYRQGNTDDKSSQKREAYASVPKSDNMSSGDIEMAIVTTPNAVLVEPPSNWPEHGNIRFENVAMRYRDGPLVLKGVSFDVNGKDKIGIAGRTG